MRFSCNRGSIIMFIPLSTIRSTDVSRPREVTIKKSLSFIRGPTCITNGGRMEKGTPVDKVANGPRQT